MLPTCVSKLCSSFNISLKGRQSLHCVITSTLLLSLSVFQKSHVTEQITGFWPKEGTVMMYWNSIDITRVYSRHLMNASVLQTKYLLFKSVKTVYHVSAFRNFH